MSLQQWLKHTVSPARHSTKERRRGRKRVRPLEYSALEQRRMLTTFYINSLVDDASGTVDGLIGLREAMIAANTNAAFGDAPAGSAVGDVIQFPTEYNGQTTSLTAGQIAITDDVLIQGAGSIVDGGDASRLFMVATNEKVTFGNLTFTNGNAAEGGAIFNVTGGVLSIYRSTFNGNTATGAGGGAIYHGIGTMYLTESTLSGNMALVGDGGAVYSASGTTIVNGGSMTGNSAALSGGAMNVINGNFQTFDHTVSSNSAGATGGGLNNTGTATVVVSGGTVSANTAAESGGGLWNDVTGTLFVRAATSVTGNTASGSLSTNGGGGIFNNGGKVYVNSATVSNNTASGFSGSGGGVFSTAGVVQFNSSTVTGNTAARAGGGMEIIDGFTLLNASSFQTNDAGVTLSPQPGNGGAIHVTGTNAQVLMLDSTISENRARAEGGGIWIEDGSELYVRTGSRIFNNTATASTSLGGGVYSKGYVQAVDGVFSNNTSNFRGGGLYLTATGYARIIRTNFTGNNSGVEGGGIYNAGFLRISDSALTRNVVTRSGGAIFTAVGATSILENLTFSGNLPNNTN